MLRECHKCKTLKSLKEFNVVRKRRGKAVNRPTLLCKTCHSILGKVQYLRMREHRIASGKVNYKRRYNDRTKNASRLPTGKCEICGLENGNMYGRPKHLAFDHDHATGKFRGWLCDTCNRVLGMVKDSPAWLHKMAIFLESNHLWGQ